MSNSKKAIALAGINLNQEQKIALEVLVSKGLKTLVSKKIASNELGIHSSTFDRIRKSGEIKTKKIGGQVMVTIYELARYIAS